MPAEFIASIFAGHQAFRERAGGDGRRGARDNSPRRHGMGIENERGRMLIASSISRCELLIVGADLVFAR
jgi:hypothetical protein